MYPYAKNAEELESNLKEAIQDAIELAPEGVVARLSPRFARLDFASKIVVLDYPSEPWMKNPAGFMHGGIIAAAMDNACLLYTSCLPGEEGYTTYGEGDSFVVPANSKYKLIIKEVADYCCLLYTSGFGPCHQGRD